VADDEVPVISVGALNPNGTQAMFSDDGIWVTAFADGAAVLSTYPVTANASRSPDLTMPPGPTPPGLSLHRRAALDPDDFTCGWAVWSGTSFSAPHIAARFIGSLQEGARGGLKLSPHGKKAQAKAAWDNLRRQGIRRE
jgi:subtilisin family serine protease